MSFLPEIVDYPLNESTQPQANPELQWAIVDCGERGSQGQKFIYELYYKKMYAICLRYAGDADEARDLLHDGFVKLFDKLSEKPELTHIDAWIRKLFVNGCLDYVRSAYKKYIVYYGEDADVTFEEEEMDSHLFELPAPPNIDGLIAAMAKLRPDYRVVLNMYALENYSHVQIAEKLGIKEASSRSKLMRARNALKKILSGGKSGV